MYAVKVPFDDTMLYVVEGDSKFQLRPKMFETEDAAQAHAEIWGESAIVVEYKEDEDVE